jgi:hypothetical protein
MTYPREVLNRLKWTEGESLDEATIWYVHRGAPGGSRKIDGSRIRSLDRFYFEADEAAIPYHRVLRIEYRGQTLFEKDTRAKDPR